MDVPAKSHARFATGPVNGKKNAVKSSGVNPCEYGSTYELSAVKQKIITFAFVSCTKRPEKKPR